MSTSTGTGEVGNGSSAYRNITGGEARYCKIGASTLKCYAYWDGAGIGKFIHGNYRKGGGVISLSCTTGIKSGDSSGIQFFAIQPKVIQCSDEIYPASTGAVRTNAEICGFSNVESISSTGIDSSN